MEERTKITIERPKINNKCAWENVQDVIEGENIAYDIISEALKIHSNLEAEYYGTHKILRIAEVLKLIAQMDEEFEF